MNQQQGRLNAVAMALLFFCVTLSMYAGTMSGSPALFPCRPLLLSEIARGGLVPRG